MQLAYATFYEARSTASGFSRINSVGYYIARALENAGHGLEHLGPVRTGMDLPYRILQELSQRYFHKSFNYHRSSPVCRRISADFDKKLSHSNAQAVICPVNPGSPPIAYCKCKQPVVLWWDSTLKTASRSYHDFTAASMSRSNLRDGLRNEAATMERCDLIAFSSPWACENAITDYQLNPGKVRCVPFGANIDHAISESDLEKALVHRAAQPWRLLFIGLDWGRKDGDTVLSTARVLHERGIPVQVTLIGSQPAHDLPDYVKALGVLDRANPDNLALIQTLLAESHMLFVPSRNEAFGHVFCEAAAYGLPSLTRDIEGIPSSVTEGITGYRLPGDADATAFADRIEALKSDPSGYVSLCRSALAEYNRRLNWDSCVAELLRQMKLILPI